MYKLFLNDTEVTQPSNLIDLILTKVRSEIFSGFVVGTYGYYDNNEGLEISDYDTVDLIKSLLQVDGVNASVKAELKYCEQTIFVGSLDFSTYQNIECCKVSINLSSDPYQDLINSKRLIDYSITTQSKIVLTKKNYISGGNYELGTQSKFKVTSTGVHLNIGIPLKSDNKIPGMQDATIGDGTLFIAQKDGIVKIMGSINWSENLTHNYDIKLTVKNGGGSTISDTVLQSYIHASGVVTLRQYSLNQSINVLEGYKISLSLQDSTINVPYEINFISGTNIAITDDPNDSEIANESDCFGIYAFDAFKEIVKKISPNIIVKSDFFESGYGKGDFLTNGNNIRGILSDINLSLEYVFSNFDALYDLKLDFEGNELRIEPQSNNSRNASFINAVATKYREYADIDRLYSSVKVGFSTWQSESKLKGLEHNSIRTYESNLSFGSRELSLVSDFITAGYIIEEQRRLQYDVNENQKEHKFDENIFLIATENGSIESITKYNPVANIILSGGVYNLKYTPLNVLQYNARKLQYLSEIKFASGEGNISMVIGGNFENSSFNFGENMPMKCEFDAVIDFEEFKELNEIGIVACGEDKFIKCDEINLNLQVNGKGFVNIKGELI